MAYAVSNGHVTHVTDDVTWPRKIKVVSRDLVIYLHANILKTRQFVPDRLYIVDLESGVAAECWVLVQKNCKWQFLEFPNGNSRWPCRACCRNGHFACVKCYIFVLFSSTPISILNLTISSESQWNIDSNDILSVRKYCQLFTNESNTFLGEQYIVEDWTECAQTDKTDRQKWKQYIHQFHSVHLEDIIKMHPTKRNPYEKWEQRPYGICEKFESYNN